MTRCLAVAVAALLFGASRGVAAPISIQVEPEMQRQIAAVAAAASPGELKAPLARLRQAGEPEYASVMPQLVYFSMRATDVREGMAAAVVIRELGITREQQLNGIAPYLGTSDPALARELRSFLGNLDDASATRPPDFRPYQPLLRARAGDPPVVLIQYMLATAPDEGLATLVEVYVDDPGRRAALLSTRGDLQRLAADPAWWVRLYVAERLRQDPTLRTAALLARLQADPHPLVRATVDTP